MMDPRFSRHASASRRAGFFGVSRVFPRALLAVALASPFAVACDGRAKSEGNSEAAKAPRSGPSVAVLDLAGGIPEQEAAGLLGVPTHKASFDRFVRTIAEIGEDKDVK